MKKRWFTDTVKRIMLWNIAIFSLLFVTSNVFTITMIHKILTDNLDEKLKNEIETLLGSFTIENDSIKVTAYSELKEPDFSTLTPNSYLLQIYSKTGKVIAVSKNIKAFGNIPLSFPNIKSKYAFEEIAVKDHQLRTIYFLIHQDSDHKAAYLQLSVFKTENSSIINRLIIFNLLNLPLILFIIVLVSVFLAKKSYAPLNKIITIAEKTTTDNLNTKIEYKADSGDELGRLRDTLNNLFTRLDEQVNHISHFTDNASHQLMTPLTAIKTELDYILKRDRTPGEYKETLTALDTQTDKMINIVKSLLIIAKYSGNPTLNKNVFNILQVINDNIKPLFTERKIIYEMENNIYLRGSAEGFRIVLENLIDNAVKYSPEESEIRVKISKINRLIEISVEDNGFGISDDEKEKIFERFYRSSNVKENVNGYGLGLCLVKTIVHSMNGSIKVEDNKPNGAKFTIYFPAIEID